MEWVCVTGATGFIASHVIQQLLEAGYSVRGTVRSLKNKAKIAHLHSLPVHSAKLELVEADLCSLNGWDACVAGCSYVLHIASPFTLIEPENEIEIIDPAVNGVLAVLGACKRANDSGKTKVKRIILTSSVASIMYGHPSSKKLFNEHDWSIVENLKAYPKSKTLAEIKAWEFARSNNLDLVVINPGFCLGPILSANDCASASVISRILSRQTPVLPDIGWCSVDVRDVALAHLKAMTAEGVVGRRFICTAGQLRFPEIGKILAKEFDRFGYNVPTKVAPYFALKVAAVFDPTIEGILPQIGINLSADASPAEKLLGIKWRSFEETLTDMGYSLIKHKKVNATLQLKKINSSM